jgi:hypothetical protein
MANFHFRLFVRPTLIGKAIIAKLTAEGTDRQADARRWLELGYAVEQAGFRLDGTTVYQGARQLAAEQPVVMSLPVPTVPAPAIAALAALQVQALPPDAASGVTAVADHDQPNAFTPPYVQPKPEPAAPATVPSASPTVVETGMPASSPQAPPAAPLMHPALADDMAANLRALSV